jgi:broad specificity phosphatase PhoE
VLQGLTCDEAAAAEPEGLAALRSSRSDMRIPGGGESLDDLQGRVVAAICEIASQHRGGEGHIRPGLLQCCSGSMLL